MSTTDDWIDAPSLAEPAPPPAAKADDGWIDAPKADATPHPAPPISGTGTATKPDQLATFRQQGITGCRFGWVVYSNRSRAGRRRLARRRLGKRTGSDNRTSSGHRSALSAIEWLHL